VGPGAQQVHDPPPDRIGERGQDHVHDILICLHKENSCTFR
jgi:hypothetical protein